MEKVTLVPTDGEYYAEHIVARHGKESATIGSKLLESVPDEYMLNLLKTTDKAYQKAIDEKGKPGRMVFAVTADRPVGTNAVYPVENLDKGAVFSTVREPGTDRAAKIKVAIVSEKDMPTTNVAQVIMGNYGPTGKAGIYTMIFGDEGMPFAGSEAAKRGGPDFAKACEDYWNTHVFLVTPKELENNIKELKSCGLPSKIQELALKSFEISRGGKSPVIKPFQPEISAGAVKMSLTKQAARGNVRE